MAPESFGPFRVVHQIGAGTLGPVFRAYDPEHDRPVAVKLFTVDLAPELVHRFVADLDRLVAAELTHPAIVRPLATGILGNSPYLVEEFVEAESLDIALRLHGPAPIPDALRIAAQIAGALDFAAVSHVHHGALHPRDVLVSGQETRLTGVGVARALEQVGIPAPNRRPYAAPERIAGGVWHRFADIFSLAALMYEMLWGRRLNGTGMQAVATLEPLRGGDLTALSLAFSRALAEDPGGRYSRALKFVEGLKNAFPGEGDTATINMSRAFPPSAHVEPAAPASPEREASLGAEARSAKAAAERHVDSEPEIFVQPPGPATLVLPVPPLQPVQPARAPVPDVEPLADSSRHGAQMRAREGAPTFAKAAVGPPKLGSESASGGGEWAVGGPTSDRAGVWGGAPSKDEPEVELDLNLTAEPEVDKVAVEPTVIAQPEPPAAAPIPAPAAVEAKPTTLPFELGPRRRDRVRYVQPENEIETASTDAGSEEDPAATPLERPPLSMLERSGSALWPLGLALILGVAIGVGIGFGGGYWTGFRDRVAPPDSAPTATTAAAPQAREYTDSAVRPAGDAAKPPPAAAAAQPSTPARRPPTPAPPSNREPAARTTPASRAPGRILVRSTPAGARVAIDGRDYGITPLAVRDLALGMHAVRVARDGYSVEERRVRVTRSRPSTAMLVTLERPRAIVSTGAASVTGGLSVDSRPAGAKVYIDGRLVGTTPLQSHAVSAGEHAIRLERDGYRRWTSAIRVVSNEQNRVTASLER